VNVPGQYGQIGIPIYQDARISPLVEMAYPFVPPVVVTGVSDIEVTHEFAYVAQRRFEEQMEVVGHEDVAVELNSIDIQCLIKGLKEPFAVGVILEYLPPFISTAGDMVHGTWILYAEGSGHGVRMPSQSPFVNIKDLTPLLLSGDDVIERSRVFDAGLAGHGKNIPKGAGTVNILILKSDPLRSVF